MDQAALNALSSMEDSLETIACNLPETTHVDTLGIEHALRDVANGFSEFSPRPGGQYFDKSLENIDTHLSEANVLLETQANFLHDIHVSLRHLAELKAGHKLDGYWADVEH